MNTKSRISLVANPSLPNAVATAVEATGVLDALTDKDGDIVVCAPGRADRHVTAARIVASLFAPRRNRVRLATPPSALRAAALIPSATKSGRWQSAPLPAPAELLDYAVLPRHLVSARTLVFVADAGDATSTDPLAIGLLARFAHPRLALAARFSNNRDVLTAEIALALRPRLIILTTSLAGHAVVASMDDLIAAELIGLALRHEHADPDADLIGPWQHPLVQRATERHLGAHIPDQIELTWSAADQTGHMDEFTKLVDRVRLAIGLS